MTAGTGKKPSVFDRILNVIRPKRTKEPDIIAQAEEVIEQYAGFRSGYLRALRRQGRTKVACAILNTAIFAVSAVIVFLVWRILR